MTIQIPERLTFRNESWRLHTLPLESYFDKRGSRPRLPPMNTACWRGYFGEWEIRDGRLYLVRLTTHDALFEPALPNDKERQELIEAINASSEITLESLFHGQQLPIFAEWFSGMLSCEPGVRCDGCNDHAFSLTIKDGVVVDAPVADSRVQ